MLVFLDHCVTLQAPDLGWDAVDERQAAALGEETRWGCRRWTCTMTRGEGHRKGATLVVGILPEPELQDWHRYSEWAERQPGRGLALKRYHLRDFPQPL